MKAFLRTIRPMVGALIIRRTVRCTKVIGLMICSMGRGGRSTKMDHNTKDTIKMLTNMVMENLNGRTAVCTKDRSSITCSMVRANTHSKTLIMKATGIILKYFLLNKDAWNGRYALERWQEIRRPIQEQSKTWLRIITK
jgi:hypothetical protein